jgi:ribosomal protein S18 acetylase RimI-like enzyme
MIREFNFARDLDAVIALWQSAGPGIHLGPSDTPEEIAKKLTRDPDLFLVAEAEGRIVGAVIGGFDGRRGAVYHLAVAPEYRGRDIGTALMNEVDSRLKAKGCLKYQLFIASDNAEVVGFYQKLGWQVRHDLTMMSKVIE